MLWDRGRSGSQGRKGDKALFSEPSGDVASVGPWCESTPRSWEESRAAWGQWCWDWVLVFLRVVERRAAVSDRICSGGSQDMYG